MIALLLNRILAGLRDALRIWWLAPVIPLIAVIPEFAQHVVEVQIGMFESREAGIAIQNDPTRWAFGYVKVAGLLVGVLLAIRFWGSRQQGFAWYSRKGVAWRVLGLALLANVVVTAATFALDQALVSMDETASTVVTGIVTIITLPLLVWLVVGLVGDREATLGGVYRGGWWAALRIAVFSAMVFVPLQYLHGLNHDWAFGAGPLLLWTLMVFDSLVVGLIAVGWGTAIHHGYQPLQEDLG